MAGKAAHEENLSKKGRTGALTKKKRKRRGMKAKPHGKGTIPAGVPTPNPPKK